MRRLAVISMVVVCLVGIAFGQADIASVRNVASGWSSISAIPSSVMIEKKVQEVSLILSVTDHKGHFVDNLQKDDLTIFDNETQQRMLTFFQSQTDLPLNVAILLDVSSSVAYHLETEQDTIRAFIREIARPRDNVTVYAFNQSVQLIVPVTNNWKQIIKTVRTMKASGETALLDAVVTASHSLASDTRPTRRIIVVLSDGQENSSHVNLDQATDEVLKSESSVYAVNVVEDKITDEGKWGESILRHLSDSTGGVYLRDDNEGRINNAFGKIQRELRSQYALAYRPSNLVGQAFHQIEVLVPGHLRVRCRSGYYEK